MVRIPSATYRLQLQPTFGFDHAARLVPYLDLLGITDLYALPLLTARPGSTHGYDVVDHSRLNPELGGEEGFERLSDTLRKYELGLLVDLVPGHMSAHSPLNGESRFFKPVGEKPGRSEFLQPQLGISPDGIR